MKFIHKKWKQEHSCINSKKDITHGYSNSQTKHDVDKMIPNAEWNIKNDKERFNTKFESNRENVEQRADDNVFVGSAKAGLNQSKDILKDVKDGYNTIKELGKKDDE